MAKARSEIAIIDTLLDVATETAKGIEQAYGVKAMAYECDVTNPVQVNTVMDRIVSDFGKLDVLFNNAGVVLHKSALDVTPEEWLNVINVNLNGVFFVAQAFAKKLVAAKRPGSIINTASMSGTIVNIPQPQASYNASKAAVIHLTKSLAIEFVEHEIRVNSISPGYIMTDLTAHVRKDWVEKWLELSPTKRMGTPEELASMVILLAGDSSKFTNGSDIIMDGAFTCV
jgi:NAD(P)-dependent dehydrogenase (short-subunit alcohol dehydrogenase family)